MPSSTLNPDYKLSEEQKAHFMEHGFVKIPQCFTRKQAKDFTSTMWTRLDFSPTDKSTWWVFPEWFILPPDCLQS